MDRVFAICLTFIGLFQLKKSRCIQEQRKLVTRLQEQVVRSLQTSFREGQIFEFVKSSSLVVCSLPFVVWRTTPPSRAKRGEICTMYCIVYTPCRAQRREEIEETYRGSRFSANLQNF